MTRPDRAILRNAGLAASILVFVWPQLSRGARRVALVSPRHRDLHPAHRVVVTWPAGDRPPAGAVSPVAVVSWRWPRCRVAARPTAGRAPGVAGVRGGHADRRARGDAADPRRTDAVYDVSRPTMRPGTWRCCTARALGPVCGASGAAPRFPLRHDRRRAVRAVVVRRGRGGRVGARSRRRRRVVAGGPRGVADRLRPAGLHVDRPHPGLLAAVPAAGGRRVGGAGGRPRACWACWSPRAPPWSRSCRCS